MNGKFLLMMARTCQRFVTYTLDLRLRMAAQIWLATFSTGITQKSPSPWAERSTLCPQLALCSLMHAQKKQRFCQDGVPSSRVLRVLLRHLPLQYVGSRPSTAD